MIFFKGCGEKMEEKNEDLLKGGLLLSSEDFGEPDKVKENKNKLLAAINNINRLHAQQQEYIRQQEEAERQAEKPEEVKLDEYILSKDIQSGEGGDNGDVMFTNDAVDKPDTTQDTGAFEPVDLNSEEYSAESETPAMAETTDTPANPEPMYVVSETEKKGKGAKKGKKDKNIKKHPYVRNSTDEEVKEGKGVAWLAYILFFIPLLIKGKNNYVRHHANEGLEIFIVDVFAVALLCVGYMVKNNNTWIKLALMVSLIAGVVLLILTTITKIVMIIMCLAGKEARTPWLGHIKFIKPIK